MRVFFRKMGIENIRFKPAYNPYTEVGVQVYEWESSAYTHGV